MAHNEIRIAGFQVVRRIEAVADEDDSVHYSSFIYVVEDGSFDVIV